MRSNIPDLAEPVLDAASEELARGLFGVAVPELIKDLPVLKYAVVAKDLYTAFRINKLTKRMKKFLDTLQQGGFNLRDYEVLSPEERQLVIDILVTELDAQTDDMQSEALALLFKAYADKKIERLMFHGVAHELKNINPLVFYFSVDGFSLKAQGAGVSIDGPLHYLSQAFYSNQTGGLQFTTDHYLTNLGLVFFDVIYTPMREKYSI